MSKGIELSLISTATLKRWLVDTKALMDHPRVPAVTGRDPAAPGRDWYKNNYAELTEEIARRERGGG